MLIFLRNLKYLFICFVKAWDRLAQKFCLVLSTDGKPWKCAVIVALFGIGLILGVGNFTAYRD